MGDLLPGTGNMCVVYVFAPATEGSGSELERWSSHRSYTNNVFNFAARRLVSTIIAACPFPPRPRLSVYACATRGEGVQITSFGVRIFFGEWDVLVCGLRDHRIPILNSTGLSVQRCASARGSVSPET